MKKTAVVILNYNGKDFLKKFLPSVIQHSPEAEIIVADNASSDDSIDFLNRHFPEIRQINIAQNLGYAGGYNYALRQVDADFYMLLNSDVEVTSNWLTPLVKFLENNPSYAACQPKIKDFNLRLNFEYAGACGGFLDALGYPYCRGRIFDEVEKDSHQYDGPIDIFWASGACMLIRSEAFHEAGGFDADFFAHMEEIDLCWRLKSLGNKLKSIPESVVYHVGGGTLNKTSPFKTYLNFRNGLFLLLKNLPFSDLLIKLPSRLLLDWLAAIKFLIGGQWKHALQILHAHASFVWTSRKMTRKRSILSPIKSRHLIVVAYFLKRRKTYSEL